METLMATELTIPLSQIVLLLGLSTLALAFGRIKIALFINYCFVLYWGQWWNVALLSDTAVLRLNGFGFLYMGFTLMMIFIMVMGFVFHRD